MYRLTITFEACDPIVLYFKKRPRSGRIKEVFRKKFPYMVAEYLRTLDEMIDLEQYSLERIESS